MIIKRKHSGSFAVIPNATADDERLSADALGTLVYLLAKPGHWKVIVADLRRRFGMGKDRAYSILQELERVGYVRRFQNRTTSNKFSTYEYVIYDGPEAMAHDAALDGGGPLPEIQEAEKPQQNPASGFTGYGGAASGNSGHIVNTKSIKSLREQNSAEAGADTPQEGFEEEKSPIAGSPAIAEISAIGGQHPIADISVSGETKVEISPLKPSGAEISAPSQMHPNVGMPVFSEIKHGSPHLPPSTSKLVWDEGRDLLKTTTSKPDQAIRRIVGKWVKRSKAKGDGREKLLAIIRAAVKAGTMDPEGYIGAALKSEFGALPKPENFDAKKWKYIAQAAINKKEWLPVWGPAPGRPRCLVPPELITAELTTALAGWSAAA